MKIYTRIREAVLRVSGRVVSRVLHYFNGPP
jgi:hypothetical protein